MALVSFRGVSFTTLTAYTSSAAGAALATIYTDLSGTTLLPNPFPCFGRYEFYALSTTYLIQSDYTRFMNRGRILLADPTAPEDLSWWITYTAGGPGNATLRIRIAGVTYDLATVAI